MGKQKSFEYYAIASLSIGVIANAVLWLGFGAEAFQITLFIPIFLAIHFCLFSIPREFLSEPIIQRGLFVAQVLCFVAMAFELEHAAPLYLCVVPYLHAFSLENNNIASDTGQKGTLFLFLGIGIFFIFEGLKNASFITIYDAISLVALYSWAIMLFLLETQSWHDYIYKRIFGRKKNNLLKKRENERYFFHDLINHTHTILLFLKSRGADGINASEINEVVSEMRLLQSIIQDYYAYRHKNLFNTQKMASLEEAENFTKNLLKLYLPNAVGHFVTKRGDGFPIVNAKISMPMFSRVMSNVIKNVSEADSDLVEIQFQLLEQKLVILVKNNVRRSGPKDDLAKTLSQRILNSSTAKSEGLGLESVTELLRQAGGDFEFSGDGQFWTNTITLPLVEYSYNLAA